MATSKVLFEGTEIHVPQVVKDFLEIQDGKLYLHFTKFTGTIVVAAKVSIIPDKQCP